VDSEATVQAFRRALQDCELDLKEQNFRNFSPDHIETSELSSWIAALSRQLEDPARAR
jgi:hypothetical protein